MNPNPTLLLVAHGSRDPRFADTAYRVRAAVAQRIPHVDVELSFLDLNTPLVADALTELDSDCVVVPLLLAPGYHSEVDLPGIIADADNPTAVSITDVVGRAGLVGSLADRLTEAGLAEGDGIIVTAVGSSNPTADRVVRRTALQLSTRLHRPVEVVYATQLGTGDIRLRNAVRRLHKAGSTRIVLSPYFLSAGLLTERVEAALDRLVPDALVAGPIGTHHALIDAVIGCYRSATRQPRQAPPITHR